MTAATIFLSSHYYPYGEEITGTANDTYKYAGLYRDSDSMLDYAMNRYYASGVGRFLTADRGSVLSSTSPQRGRGQPGSLSEIEALQST
jgi:RHS repeat-associated protein